MGGVSEVRAIEPPLLSRSPVGSAIARAPATAHAGGSPAIRLVIGTLIAAAVVLAFRDLG
jgi:hypothetical protein